MAKFAILTTLALLSACATPPVVDSGCSWTRTFDLTDDQVSVFAANLKVMRPLADDINSHNTTRAARCK